MLWRYERSGGAWATVDLLYNPKTESWKIFLKRSLSLFLLLLVVCPAQKRLGNMVSSCSIGRSSLYERSMRAREKHLSKLAHLRKEAMEQFTFTPSTTKSGRTSTTTTTSSQGFSPSHYSVRRHKHCTPMGSGRSINSVASSRIEELYRVRVGKMRARPSSDREEKVVRQRNVDEREMKGCTFRPQTNWGTKCKTQSEKQVRVKHTLTSYEKHAEVSQLRTHCPSLLRLHTYGPPLPREIIITTTVETNHRINFDSPNSTSIEQEEEKCLPPVQSISVERHMPDPSLIHHNRLNEAKTRLIQEVVSRVLETGSI